MTKPQTFRLAELTSFVQRVFALNFPQSVWVTAELAQANGSRGHYWLTLVEKDKEGDEVIAQLEGVVWAGKLRELRATYGLKLVNDLLSEGMSVRLKVTASFHARYGLRLVVEDLDPSFTIGALAQKRQAALLKLQAEGLLHKNASLTFPAIIQRLAVISSDTAAGLADFTEQLAQNPYGYSFKTRLFPAAMQGPQTVGEISARLRQIANWDNTFDAVVIIRGGGSRMDLSAFDDEALCRVVATFPLPVIVGIGHETDDSLLDHVAARSLKTPTATAVFLIEQMVVAESNLLRTGRGIAQQARLLLGAEQPRLERLRAAVRRHSDSNLHRAQQQLESLRSSLGAVEKIALLTERNRINQLEGVLNALRPEATLARGYSLVSQEGKLITKPGELQAGEVQITLKEGKITLKKK